MSKLTFDLLPGNKTWHYIKQYILVDIFTRGTFWDHLKKKSDQFQFFTPVELKVDLGLGIWPFCT